MDVYRTPEEAFAGVSDFPYEPRYADVPSGADGPATLRMAWVEDGPADGRVVLLLHGQPTWSYLYRTVVPVLAEAGLRAVAPDLVGFGRSDKPTDPAAYTYARHVAWTRALVLDALGLSDVVLVGQDWGGLVGLRLLAENPDRFAGAVLSNTGLPTGGQPMPEVWQRFRDFVATVPELPVGLLVRGGCRHGLTAAQAAAYDAPFPQERAKAGARAFPGLVPDSPDDPAVADQLRAWESLAHFERPVLCAFTDSDPITRGGDGWMRERIPGAAGQSHVTIPDAGHLVQEDAGVRLAEVVRDFALSLP